MWRAELITNKHTFDSRLYTLNIFRDEVFNPNAHKFLKILRTLPVSAATPERCFSSLKRINPDLRNDNMIEANIL